MQPSYLPPSTFLYHLYFRLHSVDHQPSRPFIRVSSWRTCVRRVKPAVYPAARRAPSSRNTATLAHTGRAGGRRCMTDCMSTAAAPRGRYYARAVAHMRRERRPDECVPSNPSWPEILRNSLSVVCVSRFPNLLGAHPPIAPRDAIRARARELRRTRAHVLARSVCLSGMQEHADDEAGTAAGDRTETPARVPYGSVERNGNSERAAPTVLVATPVDLVTERNSRTPRTRRGSAGRRPAGTDGRSASTRCTVLGVPEFPCGCHVPMRGVGGT